MHGVQIMQFIAIHDGINSCRKANNFKKFYHIFILFHIGFYHIVTMSRNPL